MGNHAVVILTDPARCQLAEAETLVQALLQVQQLSNAGVPASQAFCDHPAAAMAFIDAYSKAYPALELDTLDLPLPQHLYSMVADGRLSPLPPAVPETAKMEQAGQKYPLYVLSLGAPEALMQALQHNSIAKSSIRVLEIAPIAAAGPEPVPVAEAVAASWLTESSRAPERDDGDASGTEPLADNPVELSSVEADLDRIEIDDVRDRQTHGQNGRVDDASAAAVIETGVAGPGASPSGAGPQATVEVPASSTGIQDPASRPAVPAAPPSEPVSDTRPASATDPSDTSITQSNGPQVVAEPSDDGAEIPDEAARNDTEPSDPPVGDPSEQDLGTGGEGPTDPTPGPAQSAPDVDDAAAGPNTPEGGDGGALTGYSSVFAIPGEDVLYQPTASFSGSDDLAYALPTEDAGEPNFFAPLFDTSEGAEVVDLEAMYRDLSEPAAEGGAALNGFDFILMRAPNSDLADPNDALAAYSECEGSVTQGRPEPDEDGDLNNPLTTVHDADV